MPKTPNLSNKKKQAKAKPPKGKGRGSSSAKASLPEQERPILYPQYDVRLCVASEKSSITADEARKLLGWWEESENIKFGSDFQLRVGERKVRCGNNVSNRPLYMSVVETLKQDILRRNWRFNGEPIIIGKTGLILNGQHTLIALVLAAEDWKTKTGQYSSWWKAEPTIDKLIVLGVEEDDATVNTMDTCKPRTLADVLFRSEFFAKCKPKERRVLSRATDYAIRMLWFRTGAMLDAFAPRRTHAESINFINRHPKLLECVKHIYQEENDGCISRYISIGYASALLYLMGCSATDADECGYTAASSPSEAMLDWTHWEKACEFWVYLGARASDFKPLYDQIGRLLNEGGAAVDERIALLVKAWDRYSADQPIEAEHLDLEYHRHEDGSRVLASHPILSGIDCGGKPR